MVFWKYMFTEMTEWHCKDCEKNLRTACLDMSQSKLDGYYFTSEQSGHNWIISKGNTTEKKINLKCLHCSRSEKNKKFMIKWQIQLSIIRIKCHM